MRLSPDTGIKGDRPVMIWKDPYASPGARARGQHAAGTGCPGPGVHRSSPFAWCTGSA